MEVGLFISNIVSVAISTVPAPVAAEVVAPAPAKAAPPSGERRSSDGQKNFLTKSLPFIWPPALTAGIFAAVWYLASYVIIPDRVDFILPPLHAVVQKGMLTWNNFQPILEGLWATTQVALLGLLLAVVVGIVVAVLMSQARWVEQTLFPYAVTLQAVPILAIVPIIGLLFESDFQARVFVAFMISLFPIISNTLFGLKCATRNLHDLFTLNRANRLTRLWKLQFPAALPAMFTGLKISAGLCVVGTIVAEFFFGGGTVKGLGHLIRFDFNPAAGQGPQLYTAIFFCCLLGLVLFWIVVAASSIVTRHWRG